MNKPSQPTRAPTQAEAPQPLAEDAAALSLDLTCILESGIVAEEHPDRWALFREIRPNEAPIYRILASWYGGYLGSDSWRINSGIVGVDDAGDVLKFYGQSGTVYCCPKTRYGASSYASGEFSRNAKLVATKGIQWEPIQESEALSLSWFSGTVHKVSMRARGMRKRNRTKRRFPQFIQTQ